MNILDFINTNPNWQDKLLQHPYNIKTVWDGDYFILRYDMLKSDFNNELVRQCRGSIFKKEGEEYSCVCMPFFKFGNYGESYVKDIDWDSSIGLEKLDGSFIKLWYDNKWHWSTNNVIDASKAELLNGEYKTFYDLIKKAVKSFDFLNLLNPNYCFMFELVSPYNKVVVDYSDTMLYLIGARNKNNWVELTFDELQELSKELEPFGIDTPLVCKYNDLNSYIKDIENCKKLEEGIVVVDKNFNRAKIKTQAWLTAAKLKNNGVINTERVIRMIRHDSIDDFKSYFPQYNIFVDKVIEKYNKIKEELDKNVTEAENLYFLPRADFAREVSNKDAFVKAFLFKKYQNKNFSVNEYLDSISEKKLAKILKECNYG